MDVEGKGCDDGELLTNGREPHGTLHSSCFLAGEVTKVMTGVETGAEAETGTGTGTGTGM